MTTQTAKLTTHHIDTGYLMDGWLGFGYLGERRNAIEAVASGEWTSARVEEADAAALAVANRKGWSPERFFQWLNSKDGRYYADVTLGSDDSDIAAAAERYVR